MIGVDIIKAGTATYIKTPVGPTLNTWHHIVLTYDGTNPKIYLNKTLYTTTSAANFAPTVTTDLIVGNLAGSTRKPRDSMEELMRFNISKVWYYHKHR